jgi:predicted Zn-dependent peptidase
MNYTKTTLDNGLRVITVPMKDTKSLTFLVLFGTGSKYENSKNKGVSHFLEHMFFKGTKSRPRPGEVHQVLDDVGAEHNAFTSKEITGYWVKVSSKNVGLAIDIVSDILTEPLFKEEEIEKERGVILQEMSMYFDSPMRYIGELFEDLLYGDQPAGWDTIGTTETLLALKRDDFLNYWQSQYVGSNAVVVVAGNFREPQVIEEVKRRLESLKKGTAKDKSAVKESQKQPAAQISYKTTDQTHLVIGVRSVNMFSDQRFAASLLATILGGKTSSRLFREIREKHGLAYALSADNEAYTDSGYLNVYAGVPHKKLKEAVMRIVSEFKKLTTSGITASELSRAKEFYRGRFTIDLESSDEVASFFGGQELFRNAILSPEDLLAKIDAVTVDEVNKLSETIFQPEKANLVVIGPHKNELELQQLLAL